MSRAMRPPAAALACSLALASWSCAPASSGGAGGVLVIVVDELRADHVSLLGYDRLTTPNLDAFAAQSAVFERAWSTAPWSVPAHVSLLTGCDPAIAERYLPPETVASPPMRWRIPRAAPSLPEEMLRAGFSTAAFVDDPLIGPALGFDRGFQEFRAFEAPRDGVEQHYGAKAVFERFTRWLGERGHGEKWFAYLHVCDLVRSWDAPDPGWQRRYVPREALDFAPPVADSPTTFFAIPRRRWSGGFETLGEYEARYDAAVSMLDAELGGLLDELATRRDYAEIAVVIASTHGVSFGEGGLYLDHGGLNDADLRSLLVVRPAARWKASWAGWREASPASLIDVAPTLLEFEGLAAPRGMHGVSWRERLASPSTAAVAAPWRAVFARYGRQDGFAAMDERYALASTRPWITDPPHLRWTWYGGAEPADPRPLELWTDRDAGTLDAAQADPAAVQRLRDAARTWFEEIERQRQRYNPVDWVVPVDEPTADSPDARSGN